MDASAAARPRFTAENRLPSDSEMAQSLGAEELEQLRALGYIN